MPLCYALVVQKVFVGKLVSEMCFLEIKSVETNLESFCQLRGLIFFETGLCLQLAPAETDVCTYIYIRSYNRNIK